MSDTARLAAVADTLRYVASCLKNPDDRQWCESVAHEIEYRFDTVSFCPLCQEVDCDDDCPLRVARRHPRA